MDESTLHSFTTLAEPMADLALAFVGVGVAWWLRPLRCIGPAGPPWAWIAVGVLMPTLWFMDRLVGSPAVPLLSLAPLLVLLAGWPLAVVAMAVLAGAMALGTGLDGLEVLHRFVAVGLVPATLMLGLGAAFRRWLPPHLMVYIFARSFFGTFVALCAAGWLAAALQSAGAPAWNDRALAMLLSAFAEASLSGMLIAALVVYRPEQLATYNDRLYLPN